jgi:hypothetical protein
VAARLVATQGWERLGFARLGDYARERLGRSASSLRDLARVDAKLRELPLVEAALVEGRITWTKSRLLARVAAPDDERGWLERAGSLTARMLAREVRAIDTGALETGAGACDEDGLDENEREGLRLCCTASVRARWFYARQLAERVAGERLSPGAVLEQITAEVLSALPVEVDAEACGGRGVSWSDSLAAESAREADADSGVAERQTGDRSTAPLPDARAATIASVPKEGPSREAQLPAFLRAFTSGLEEADPFELDRRLRALVALEQRFEARVGALLSQVAATRAYRSLGLRDMEAYARERLGVSPRKARALLRLDRAGRVCPELARAYRTGKLSWVQAQTLLPILFSDLLPDDARRWRRAWVGWAVRVTVRRLEEHVERALLLRETDPEAWSATGGLPAQGAAGGATDRERQTGDTPTGSRDDSLLWISVPHDVARLFRALLCTVRRRIEQHSRSQSQSSVPASESDGFGAILEHAIEAWGGTDPRVRAEWRVFERDGWRCTAPGCSSRRNLHDHHIRFRSAGGADALSNRTTLCAWHHLRGVHAGIVRCVGEAPERLEFELGVRRRGPPLVRYRSGDRLTGQPPR